MLISRITFVGSLALILVGCGESANTSSPHLVCSPGELRVEGDIDGTPVSLTQSTENSGISQSDVDGGLWMSNPSPDGTRMNLTINWSPAIPDGATSNVTNATLVMPTQLADSGIAGQSLCAGTGSQIRIPKQSENAAGLQFNLMSLTGGAGCAEARTGTLRGCWRSHSK